MKDNWKWGKINFENEIASVPVKIVQAGGIAIPTVAGGKIVPVLLIDTEDRPDIEQIIDNHNCIENGNVNSIWARLSNNPLELALHLKFTEPSACSILINFFIPNYVYFISCIINSKMLYIQPGKPGDKVSTTYKDASNRVIIGICCDWIESEWYEIAYQAIRKHCKDHGLTRKEAEIQFELTTKDISFFNEFKMKRR